MRKKPRVTGFSPDEILELRPYRKGSFGLVMRGHHTDETIDIKRLRDAGHNCCSSGYAQLFMYFSEDKEKEKLKKFLRQCLESLEEGGA